MKVRSLGLHAGHMRNGLCRAPPCGPSTFGGGQGGMKSL
jgi:hypothetical protein